MSSELGLCAIVELDTNGDVLKTWSYAMDEEISPVLISKAFSAEKTPRGPFVSRFAGNWLYCHSEDITGESLSRVKSVAIFVGSGVFHCEKYLSLCSVMHRLYCETGSPVRVLEVYLAVLTTGNYKPGGFEGAGFDQRKSLLGGDLVSLVQTIGAEVVVLWSAVMTKKRVGVYSADLGRLVALARAVPLLCWHRQDWSSLFPFITPSAAEVADVKASGYYVCGFVDEQLRSSRDDLFDVVVDLDGRSVTISDKAKPSLQMAKFHKDLAQWFSQSSQEGDQQAMVKALAIKTKELLANIQELETPKDRQPTAMERFCISVAQAEGIQLQ